MQIEPEKPSAKMSDALLARMAASGDDEAFALLMHRLAPTVKSFSAQYRHLSGIEPDDLAQEGLLGLLAAVQAYREELGAFSAFAATCMRNRMVSAVRRSLPVNKFETAQAAETLSSLPDGQADPAQLLVQQEEARRLRDRLKDALTPLEYRVLIGYFGGQSYREIALTNAISDKAVDNALQRVRRKLSDGSFHWSCIRQ